MPQVTVNEAVSTAVQDHLEVGSNGLGNHAVKVLAPEFVVANVVNVEHFDIPIRLFNHRLTNSEVERVIERAFERRKSEEDEDSRMIRSNDVEDFLMSLMEEGRLESRHYYAYFGVLVCRLHSNRILYLGLLTPMHHHLYLRCTDNNTYC